MLVGFGTVLLSFSLVFGASLNRNNNLNNPSELSKECDYDNSIRTYFCKNVHDVFPNKFYGNYHLKCVNCDIRTFTNSTFPYTNSLVSFNVSESNIRYIMPRAFSSLTSTQYIYLQNNDLLEVAPEAFWGLRQVYELHLENNEIVNLYPGILAEMEANSVDLSKNKIRELPNGAFEGSLGILMLDISQNNIRKINENAFLSLVNLEILNLEGNKICHLPLGLFKNLNTLRNLNLADNKLSKFAIGTFSGLKNLHILNLANNTLFNFDGNFLLPLSQLSKLDISANGIYYFDANTLHVNVRTLRVLRLDDNILDCNLLMGIIQYFKSVSVDVVNTVKRYHLQNIDGIACTEVAIRETAKLEDFLKVAQEDAKKSIAYC